MNTPNSLPVDGRLFCIRIPNGEEWSALLIGAIATLAREEYWQETSGITIESTVAAWVDALWNMSHTSGVPVP